MAERPRPIRRKNDYTATLRPPAAVRGYDRDWQCVRAAVLDEEPLCRHCREAGRVTAAVLVDHIRALSDGGARLDRANLQPLCVPCHARKSAADLRDRRRHH